MIACKLITKEAILVYRTSILNINWENTMLRAAILFLVIAVIAGLFGLFRVEYVASEIAWILFVVFLIFAIVSFIFGRSVTRPLE